MDSSKILYATYTLSDEMMWGYGEEHLVPLENEVRRRLAVELVGGLPPDISEITINFLPREKSLYGQNRYFATARVNRVKELEAEIDMLRARVRSLEWGKDRFKADD